MAKAENRYEAKKAVVKRLNTYKAVWGDCCVDRPHGTARKGNYFKSRGYDASYRHARKAASHAAAHASY